MYDIFSKNIEEFEVETKFGPLNLETVVDAYKKTGIQPDEYSFKRCALGAFVELHAPGSTNYGRVFRNGNDRAAYILGMADSEEARQVTLWFFDAVHLVRERIADV